MADIGVVHLARAGNGIEPFRRFLASYRDCPGGMAHTLLIVYKGFDAPDALRAHEALLDEYAGGVPRQTLYISDAGFDITAYAAAARHFAFPYLCFLNSYTQLRDPDWLAKMAAHVTQSGVGVVGASGSWETTVPPLAAERARLSRRGLPGRIRGHLRFAYQRVRYPAFPNAHLRTNGFLLARDLALQLKGMSPRAKQAAHDFESGRHGMTRQIQARGLRPLVVGRDGVGYEIAEWPRSNTFRQGDQANLLMSDNRVEIYARGTFEERKMLCEVAWQGQALPPGRIIDRE